MPTTLRILGWEAEGLRCPDHEVDCRDNQGRPFGVSLIQMPNGTGKTTTLSLLRAALSGAAENGSWIQKQVRDLQKRDDTDTGGLFELRLAVNEKPSDDHHGVRFPVRAGELQDDMGNRTGQWLQTATGTASLHEG